MALTYPIAGAYTGTYNAASVGYTRRGFELHFAQQAEKVDETDIYARQLLDLIYQAATVDIMFIGRIYASMVAMLWPWHATLGTVYDATNPMGRRASDAAAKAFVLTSIANTSAAALPATVTAAKAIPAPENDVQVILNSQAREVPMKLNTLLSDSAGTGTLLVLT